jgi:acyl-CoA synthetase (NDP forming)
VNEASQSKLTRFAALARRAGRATLSEQDGKTVLAEYGIAVPRSVTVTDGEACAEACSALNPPFAVKGVAAALVHKSDAGAVRLNLEDGAAIQRAIAEIEASMARQGHIPESYLIEEMAPAGHEMVIGGINDAQFGPTVMVGLGGVFVEVFADVAFRICPLEREDAHAMLAELTAAPILRGARGGIAASEEALVDVILRVGGADGLLMQHQADIAELDINPLIVSAESAVAVDARFVIPEEPGNSPADSREIWDESELRARFRPLFEPRNIAVVGASASGRNRANNFLDQVLAYGFDRKNLYMVHPTAKEIGGLKAYPSLSDTPEPVDYGYVAIPATGIPDLLASAEGRLRFAHVTSSGFAEAGDQALQDALGAAARQAGIRVLGPNCIGGHSPRGKLTFCFGSTPEAGSVGVLLQSGGLGVDTIRRGNHRGIRYSGVMTVGNCVDVTPNELLAYYLADPATRVVGMYLEGVSNGRQMFELLQERRNAKPVVILKGGRTELGRAAALSHTGTLAGDDRLLEAFARQTGIVLADTLDMFVDQLLALQCLTPRIGDPTHRVVLFGNGGGASVLGVDTFARVGLKVAPFQPATVERLKALKLAPGASYANPVDTPRPVLLGNDGVDAERVLDIVFTHEDPQAVVMHVNMSVIVSQASTGEAPLLHLLDAADRVRRRHPDKAHFAMVLRSDGNIEYEKEKNRYRGIALERGFPVFDEIPAAANGIAAIAHHERYLARIADNTEGP